MSSAIWPQVRRNVATVGITIGSLCLFALAIGTIETYGITTAQSWPPISLGLAVAALASCALVVPWALSRFLSDKDYEEPSISRSNAIQFYILEETRFLGVPPGWTTSTTPDQRQTIAYRPGDNSDGPIAVTVSWPR